MTQESFVFKSGVQDRILRAAAKYAAFGWVKLADAFGITLIEWSIKHHPEKYSEMTVSFDEADSAAARGEYSAALVLFEKAVNAHYKLTKQFDEYLREVYRTRGAVDLRAEDDVNREMAAA